MPPKISKPSVCVFLLAALCACGGGDEAGSTGSDFSAVIDGKSWAAEPLSISAQANAGVKNTLIVVGSQNSAGKNTALTLIVHNVGGPGKYALGVSSSVIGGSGHVGEGTGGGADANSWITPSSGVAGVVELSAVGAGRVAGTFSFTAEPGKNNVMGTNRVVTNGKFNLSLNGEFAPLAENMGSKVSAEMNGVLYNAHTINGGLTDFTGKAGFNLSSISSGHGLSINLVGVTAPGSFSLSNKDPQRLLTAGRNGGNANSCCWGVNAPGDVGEVVVTSLTPKRVAGTFSATLKPQPNKPATADLVITNGIFSVGVP